LTLKLLTSMNGGAVSALARPRAGNPFWVKATDPWVTFAPDGTAYVMHLAVWTLAHLGGFRERLQEGVAFVLVSEEELRR
jgi:hypothetical protein